MLLSYSHWNAEYRVAFSAVLVVALYRGTTTRYCSTPEYQVPGTATADTPMHTVELEYYLSITSAQRLRVPGTVFTPTPYK